MTKIYLLNLLSVVAVLVTASGTDDLNKSEFSFMDKDNKHVGLSPQPNLATSPDYVCVGIPDDPRNITSVIQVGHPNENAKPDSNTYCISFWEDRSCGARAGKDDLPIAYQMEVGTEDYEYTLPAGGLGSAYVGQGKC